MKNINLNPWYITGLTDGEGCWTFAISQDPTRKLGYNITVSFEIGLDKSDENLLNNIKNFFNIGKVYKSGNIMRYKVTSVKDIIKFILPHFDKYPLRTQKRIDYLLFKKAIMILYEKGVNIDTLQDLLSIRASLNRGLSKKLQKAFPNVKPIGRDAFIIYDTYVNKLELNPYWILGFVDGEGSFPITISKLANNKRIRISFWVTQHIRDFELLNKLVLYFKCGKVNVRKHKQACDFIVAKFSDISNKLIPFFEKYTPIGNKHISYSKWILVSHIVKNKNHLNKEGVKLIEDIKYDK